jgi:heat shock protein HslJ
VLHVERFSLAGSLAVALAIVLGACSTNEPIVEGRVIHELEGTRWALAELFGKSSTVGADAREPFIALQSTDTRIVGYAGCNRIAGRFERSGEHLRFSQIASTRMACPEMAVEDALLKALDATVRWSISGDQLELLGEEGVSLARFKARNL